MKKFLHEQSFTQVGVVRKSYGYKGDVKLGIDEIFEDDVLAANYLFIDIDGFRVPYRVSSFNTKKDIVVKLDKVNDATQAGGIISRPIFMLTSDIVHAKEAMETMNQKHELIGYRIHDQTSNSNFLVKDLREFPQQIMAVVDQENREILIPLNDQFIEHINQEEKVVHMNLPEGLLDL